MPRGVFAAPPGCGPRWGGNRAARGHSRFPHEVVAYAVWIYRRFALSTADVEDLLAEQGVIVSRETVLKWVNRFGRYFAQCIKRDRPVAADT